MQNAILNIFTQRIEDIFTQDWYSRLENSTRARCYLTFAYFKYQKYLDFLNIVKYRKCFSRLRISSHRLEVEVGRWAKPNKIPYEKKNVKSVTSKKTNLTFYLSVLCMITCARHISINIIGTGQAC